MPRNFFIIGGILAFIGVILARVIARFYFTGHVSSVMYIVGIITATIGLFCIALGYRQRIKARLQSNPPVDQT